VQATGEAKFIGRGDGNIDDARSDRDQELLSRLLVDVERIASASQGG
jgi:hypothetical protein